MYQDKKVAIVAAIGKKRELGFQNKLLWHIPDDLKRFQQLTMGHPIIMGRKTFESIVGYIHKPLPGRTNIVVTRDPEWTYDGVLVAPSLEDAFNLAVDAPGSDEIHIGGGAQLYEQALPYVDRLYVTLIDDSKPADSFFPEYRGSFDEEKREGPFSHDGLSYEWMTYQRKA